MDVACYWPQIELTKTGDALSKIGDGVTYSIKLDNTHPGCRQPARPVLHDQRREDWLQQDGDPGVWCKRHLDPGVHHPGRCCRSVPQHCVGDLQAGGGDGAGRGQFHLLGQRQLAVEHEPVPAGGRDRQDRAGVCDLGRRDHLRLHDHQQELERQPEPDAGQCERRRSRRPEGGAQAAGCDNLVYNGTCSFTATYTVPDVGLQPKTIKNVVTVHYNPAGFPNDVTGHGRSYRDRGAARAS